MQGFVLIAGEAFPSALIADGRGGYRIDEIGAVSCVGDRWTVAGSSFDAQVASDGGDGIWIHLDGRAFAISWRDAVNHFARDAGGASEDVLRAPMPGVVISVSVAAGDAVATGDALLLIESMKLETTVRAPRDGIVEIVHVDAGAAFERDTLLVSLKGAE